MQVSRVQVWDPFTALARMDREFDSLVRRAWGTDAPARAGFVPAVEIRREDSDVVVVLELPGLDPERDVAIEVERGKLVVSGERRDALSDEAAEGVLVRELRYGSFRREFALPSGITAEQVEASYDGGLLSVRVKAVVQPEPSPVRVPVTTGSTPTETPVIEG